MKVVIGVGGSGGHLYPALAYAQGLQRHQHQVVFIGGDDQRLETVLVPEAGFRLLTVFNRADSGGLGGKLLVLGSLVLSLFNSLQYLLEERPQLVVGFGGQVSVPVLMAAHLLGIPTIIHEQNALLGRANRLLLPFTRALVTCFPSLINCTSEKQYFLGNPRASEVLQTIEPDYWLKFPLDYQKPLVLIVMGSQASYSINQLMKGFLQEVDERYQYLLVSGDRDYQEVREAVDPRVVVVPYLQQDQILMMVDVIVCRAGATTLAEIAVKQVPAVLIPSPYVLDNHQLYNARYYVEAGAALMIQEDALTKELLTQKIEEALVKRELFRHRLAHLASKRALERMVHLSEEICKNK